MVFLQQSSTNENAFMVLSDPARATHFSIDGETRPIAELDESLVRNASTFVTTGGHYAGEPSEGLPLPTMNFGKKASDEQGDDEQNESEGLSLPKLNFARPGKSKADAEKNSDGLSLPVMSFD